MTLPVSTVYYGGGVGPTIGDNRPPVDLIGKADALLATADRWVQERGEVTTEELAGRAGDFLAQITATEKALDAEREARKKPHLDAGRAVDAEYKPALAKLEACKAAIKRMLAGWLRKKEEALAEARRKADAEAEVARKAAAEAQRIADKSGAPSAVVAAGDAAVLARTAEAAAAAAAQAKPQVKGTLASRAASFRTTRRALIVDYAKALAFYAAHQDVRATVERLAAIDARAGIAAPGCEIIEERNVA